MSRSFKKNPIHGVTVATSEKFDKQKYNRRLRKINKLEVLNNAEIFSLKQEIVDIWDMPKDGKIRTSLTSYKILGK